MSRLGRGLPNNALMRVPLLVKTPVVFDAVGAGSAANSTSWSWSHTITGNAALVFLETFTSSTPSTVSAKVGTTNMTLLASLVNYYTSFGYSSVYAFGLLNPPTGTQTMSASCSLASSTAVNSVSYKNVTGFAPPVTNSGTGTTLALAVPSLSYQMVPMVFSDFNSTLSGYNQTSRSSQTFVSGTNLSVIIGDAQGASSLSFSATGPSAGWGAIAVPLL